MGLDIIAQYKKSPPDEDYWWSLFKDYNIVERAALVRKSRLYRILVTHLGSNKNIRVLEGGCGIGKIALPLLEDGYNVTGIDYDERIITKVKKELPHLRDHFMRMDVRALRFKDGTFDAYISPGVVEHFRGEEQRAILAEAWRVLKPDGKLLFIVPYMNAVKTFKATRIQAEHNAVRDAGGQFYQYVYSKNAAHELLEHNGFLVVASELLGLHDTKVFGRTIIPRFLQDNKLLLKLFGTTICVVATKKKA